MQTLEELKAIAELEMRKVKMLGAYIIEPAEGDDDDENERKRKRERMARLFWDFRLKTGTANMQLINDALANAPRIVESERIKAIKRLAGFAQAYPERAEEIGMEKR
jgi:hypothetical protein